MPNLSLQPTGASFAGLSAEFSRSARQKPKRLLASVGLVCALHCNAGTPPPEVTEIQLAFQEQKHLPAEQGYVQFAGYHDSRCPSNVVCGVAGEAYALLWVTGVGQRGQVVALPWSGGEINWRNSVNIGGFEVLLLGLEPRPLHGERVSPSDYRAAIAVRPRASTRTQRSK